MGILYHYVDEYMKSTEYEDLDKGDITLTTDLLKPDRKLFNSEYFYNWANVLYYKACGSATDEPIYLKIFTEGV